MGNGELVYDKFVLTVFVFDHVVQLCIFFNYCKHRHCFHSSYISSSRLVIKVNTD